MVKIKLHIIETFPHHLAPSDQISTPGLHVFQTRQTCFWLSLCIHHFPCLECFGYIHDSVILDLFSHYFHLSFEEWNTPLLHFILYLLQALIT